MSSILFLTQVLPYPLDAGPKIRIYYVLRYLTQYHAVTLVSFLRANEAQYIPHLEQFCRSVHTVPMARGAIRDAWGMTRALARNEPFLIARDHVPAMHDAIRRVRSSTRFDTVHADQLNMAQYALAQTGIHRVLDEHNAVYTITQRLAQNELSAVRRLVLRREQPVLERYEADVIRHFDAVITVSEQDRKSLLVAGGDRLPPLANPPCVIPICIDPEQTRRVPLDAHPRDLVCVGGMFYPPNVDGMVWFAENALPMVWEKSPFTRLFVVGARPAPELIALAAREPRIVVTHRVDDPTPYLSSSAAFIVPLRAGGGMRVKILDAWMWGVPIITTTLGYEGIQATDGIHLLVADEPPAMANAILDLIQHPELGRALAENGRRRVEETYNWRRVYQAWDTIYPHQAV